MAESKRRTMREAAQAILSAKVPEGGEAFSVLRALGIDNPTGADLILLAQANKATKGDTEAARFVRDTSGEKPKTLLNIAAMEGPLSNDTLRALSDEQLKELMEKRKES